MLSLDINELYNRFNNPVTAVDCGKKCAPHNSSGKPFCCDICHAVPAAYHQEWTYLKSNTDLWHPWRGDECIENPEDPAELLSETPDHMLLLACKGPTSCQRQFRILSCRDFPFFPYVTSDYRFLGLAYDWEFESTCWVISNLGLVSDAFRREFIQVYDELFALWQEEFDSYAVRSEQAREHFAAEKRRMPVLHRNGAFYLLSPINERLQRVAPEHLQCYGVYKNT